MTNLPVEESYISVTSVGGNFIINLQPDASPNPSITFPFLQSIGGNFEFVSFVSLGSVSLTLSSLESIGGYWYLDGFSDTYSLTTGALYVGGVYSLYNIVPGSGYNFDVNLMSVGSDVQIVQMLSGTYANSLTFSGLSTLPGTFTRSCSQNAFLRLNVRALCDFLLLFLLRLADDSRLSAFGLYCALFKQAIFSFHRTQ